MSKLLIAGLFVMFSATASAGETGIINQAGPYEATMRFYLHPAHGFPGKAEAPEQVASATDAKDKPRAQSAPEPESRRQAKSQAPHSPNRADQVATPERR